MIHRSVIISNDEVISETFAELLFAIDVKELHLCWFQKEKGKRAERMGPTLLEILDLNFVLELSQSSVAANSLLAQSDSFKQKVTHCIRRYGGKVNRFI